MDVELDKMARQQLLHLYVSLDGEAYYETVEGRKQGWLFPVFYILAHRCWSCMSFNDSDTPS